MKQTRIVGLAGWSGSGKTTLLGKIIPMLVASGTSVSTLKHAHHNFDVDRPGKDSYIHRQAGATEVLVASANRFALMHELRGAAEPGMADLLRLLSPVDLVIVEGWKAVAYAKIEVFRAEVGKPPLFGSDPYIKGIAADCALPDADRPAVALSDLPAVIALIRDVSEPVTDVIERLSSPAFAEM